MRLVLLLAVCGSTGLAAQAAHSESRIDPQGWPWTNFSLASAQEGEKSAPLLALSPRLLMSEDQPRGPTHVEPAAPLRQPTCPRPGLDQAECGHPHSGGSSLVALDGADIGVFSDCGDRTATSTPTPIPPPMTTPASTSTSAPALDSAPPAAAALGSSSASTLSSQRNQSRVAGLDCERHAAASPSTLTPTPMTTPAWTPALASAPAAASPTATASSPTSAPPSSAPSSSSRSCRTRAAGRPRELRVGVSSISPGHARQRPGFDPAGCRWVARFFACCPGEHADYRQCRSPAQPAAEEPAGAAGSPPALRALLAPLACIATATCVLVALAAFCGARGGRWVREKIFRVLFVAVSSVGRLVRGGGDDAHDRAAACSAAYGAASCGPPASMCLAPGAARTRRPPGTRRTRRCTC